MWQIGNTGQISSNDRRDDRRAVAKKNGIGNFRVWDRVPVRNVPIFENIGILSNTADVSLLAKNQPDPFSRFDKIPARDRQTTGSSTYSAIHMRCVRVAWQKTENVAQQYPSRPVARQYESILVISAVA